VRDHEPKADAEANPRPAATVERAGLHADGTRLVLRDGRAVQLTALPDADGPRRVRRVLRRVTQVDLHLSPEHVSAGVVGLAHRRSCRLPVSLGTALALTLQGVPTVLLIDDAVAASADGRPAGALA
jgi:hypothetical protein